MHYYSTQLIVSYSRLQRIRFVETRLLTLSFSALSWWHCTDGGVCNHTILIDHLFVQSLIATGETETLRRLYCVVFIWTCLHISYSQLASRWSHKKLFCLHILLSSAYSPACYLPSIEAIIRTLFSLLDQPCSMSSLKSHEGWCSECS